MSYKLVTLVEVVDQNGQALGHLRADAAHMRLIFGDDNSLATLSGSYLCDRDCSVPDGSPLTAYKGCDFVTVIYEFRKNLGERSVRAVTQAPIELLSRVTRFVPLTK
jgi:hypothetical protein